MEDFKSILESSLSEFKNIKNIDIPTMTKVLEDVFRTLIRKKYGSDDGFDIIANDQGDLQIFREREIVPHGEVEDERYQISINDALAISEHNYKKEIEQKNAQIEVLTKDVKKLERAMKRKIKKEIAVSASEEEEVERLKARLSKIQRKSIERDPVEVMGDFFEEVTILTFGRRAIMAARQTLISRILELEKDKVYQIYKDKVGDIVVGEIHQVLKRELMVVDDDTGAELILPKTEMVRGDFFRKGDMVKSIVHKVEMKNGTPFVILSRTSDAFLEKLLEQEVPEIEDGLITIRKIVRAPGERAKVAVESYDERIDPVGACVGMKGSRIHGIVRELKNENIDIINYTNNESLFIQRALTPARITSIELDTENNSASVYLKPEEISKAIGRKGINIKLASKLADYTIDVYRDSFEEEEYDIELDEFRDEIDEWVIEQFKSVGCDTAKSVLELNTQELLRRTDLEEETILEVVQILQAEFEEEL